MFDGVAQVGVEPAIVTTFCGDGLARPSSETESSPVLLGLTAPVFAPVCALRTVVAPQFFLLRIHPVFDERSAGPVNREVRAGSVRKNACLQRRSQMPVVQANVEGIIHLRRLALPQRRGCNRPRLSEQNQRLVEEVWTKIKQHARARHVRSLTPCARFWPRAKAIVTNFVLDDGTQSSGSDDIPHRAKISVPTPVLIHGQQAALTVGERHKFGGFFPGWGERFVHHDVATSHQAGLGKLKVRIVGSGDHAETNFRVGEQFIERTSHAHVWILLLRSHARAFENTGKFHPRDAPDHRSVECLTRDAKADEAYS